MQNEKTLLIYVSGQKIGECANSSIELSEKTTGNPNTWIELFEAFENLNETLSKLNERSKKTNRIKKARRII